MRGILWQSDAWDEYVALQSDKARLKKVNRLVSDIQRNGYDCSYGRPELLRGDLSGYASVRIDKGNRLIFKVTDENVMVIACGGHYGDK